MKKLNKLGYISIGIIFMLMFSMSTPAFAATQISPFLTVTKTIAAKTTKNVAVKSVLTAKDSKGYTLTFIISTKSAHGSVSLSKATTKGSGAAKTYTITASYTPAKNYVGSDSYTVSVKDGKGGTAVSKVTVTVSEPVTTPAPITTSTPTPTTTTTPTPEPTVAPTTTPDTSDNYTPNIVVTKDKDGVIHETMDYKFVLDQDAIGKWEQIEAVETFDQFDSTDITRRDYIEIGIHNFYGDGRMVSYVDKSSGTMKRTWTKGYVLRMGEPDTISSYEIKQLNGKTFMFVQLKNADYTMHGRTPIYFVFVKTSDTPDPDFAPVAPVAASVPTLIKINGVDVNLPGSIKDDNTKLTTTTDADGNRHDSLDYKFTLDKDAVGEWKVFESYDGIYTGFSLANNFKPGEIPSKNIEWSGNSIYADGTMVMRELETYQGNHCDWTGINWTKGYFVNPAMMSGIPAYAITTINGKTYMIVEWKSGDYKRNGKICYYIFVKTSDTPAPHPQIERIFKQST